MRHEEHKLIDKIFLGKEYDWVHKFADIVKGRGHRKKFGHDIESVLLTYLITKDKKATLSHILHILADNYDTNRRTKKIH